MSAFPMPTDASLIATFYLATKHVNKAGLREKLIQEYALSYAEQYDQWRNRETRTILACYAPPNTDDTAVVELILNCTPEQQQHDAPTMWHAHRTRLERILDTHNMQWLHANGLRGYRLVYEARAADNSFAADTPLHANALAPLMHPVQMLNATDNTTHPLPLLATTHTPHGRIWLLHIPLPHLITDVHDKATVYLALSTNDHLMRDVLTQRTGALLMPDMIAHKGYAEMREYHNAPYLTQYNAKVTELRHAVKGVIMQQRASNGDEQPLHRLITAYEALLGDVLQFAAIRVSLGQQVGNYQLWQQQHTTHETPTSNGHHTIMAYHALHLEIAQQDVTNLLAKGQDALAITSTTVSIRHTQLQQHYEEQQQQRHKEAAEQREQAQTEAIERNQRLTNILTILGVALTVPQIITTEVTKNLLDVCWHIRITNNTSGFILLLPFGMQILITVVIGFVIWKGVKWWQSLHTS